MSWTLDVVCLSHLRWDFVYQRPQHLLSRCARDRRVFFVEEPCFHIGPPRLAVSERQDGLRIVVPWLPEGMSGAEAQEAQRELLDQLLTQWKIRTYVLWYYTPMGLCFTRHLNAPATVYDCMDELSAFAGAPAEMSELEEELLRKADIVFTGGQSLYEAKRDRHPKAHLFPSSVDFAHFARARQPTDDPTDQAFIRHPRLGFFGVIDERFDRDLIGGVAETRPDWQLVLVGPLAKIDPSSLPVAHNIYYLGAKSYSELPAYLAGWEVALLPFAMNESTRFISPTKTPEYLAAGKPVISTPVRDVVRPYGDLGLAKIAGTVDEFVAAVEAALVEDGKKRILRADAFLAQTSWDQTWERMSAQIEACLNVSASNEVSAASSGTLPYGSSSSGARPSRRGLICSTT